MLPFDELAPEAKRYLEDAYRNHRTDVFQAGNGWTFAAHLRELGWLDIVAGTGSFRIGRPTFIRLSLAARNYFDAIYRPAPPPRLVSELKPEPVFEPLPNGTPVWVENYLGLDVTVRGEVARYHRAMHEYQVEFPDKPQLSRAFVSADKILTEAPVKEERLVAWKVRDQLEIAVEVLSDIANSKGTSKFKVVAQQALDDIYAFDVPQNSSGNYEVGVNWATGANDDTDGVR